MRICISDKFPGDADVAGPGTTVLEALPSHTQPNTGWVSAESGINHVPRLSAEEAVR